ncbi:MAG: Ppx/GppA phosphatase family protein [Acidiferrobacterales bacterium]|nr:Ppx/GppA phosphatase family protein [Acidiferrobacterales bacterium]
MTSSPSAKDPESVAAVDLGSNSFHLVIARLENERLVVVDRIKDIVRLGGGLDNNSNLTADAQTRALDCLGQFGQRLIDIPSTNVRAVGTNTFRKARNIADFLPKAERALGHTIDVITGREEARLIYESVCYGLSESKSNRLVIDIGGGSTEVIVGSGHDPHLADSLYIGCVSLSVARFPDNRICEKAMLQAELDAQLEIRGIHRQFRDHGWDKVLGCSGTINAVSGALRHLQWSDGTIDIDSLHRLRQETLRCKHTSELVQLGFEPIRCEVLPGGLAILCALFEWLGIQSMQISDLALREGVMYDLLGRLRNDDARQRTVRSLASHWSIDETHAMRVRKLALNVYDQVESDWFANTTAARSLLSWAATLHEIGLSIAHAKYHQHGAYLLQFSDMAGFSKPEQAVLAILVGGHRRNFPVEFSATATHLQVKTLKRLCIILRLAVLLHRPRTDRSGLSVRCLAKKKRIHLAFPDDWLNRHPLTKADLEREKQYLHQAGFHLQVTTSQ